MNIIDIIFVLICLFFIIRAGIRGFIVELFSLLAFIIGVWGSIKLFPFAVSFFNSSPEESSAVMKVLIYGGIFLALYILIKVIEKLLSKFITVILLSGLNRVLGIGLGLLEAIFIIQVCTTLLIKQEIFDFDFQPFLSESQILGYIDTYLSKVMEFLGI